MTKFGIFFALYEMKDARKIRSIKLSFGGKNEQKKDYGLYDRWVRAVCHVLWRGKFDIPAILRMGIRKQLARRFFMFYYGRYWT